MLGLAGIKQQSRGANEKGRIIHPVCLYIGWNYHGKMCVWYLKTKQFIDHGHWV